MSFKRVVKERNGSLRLSYCESLGGAYARGNGSSPSNLAVVLLFISIIDKKAFKHKFIHRLWLLNNGSHYID